MKQLQDLLLLGDPRLYQTSVDVEERELHEVKNWVEDLHNVMEEIRAKYRFGRGIAAPQLGIMKRLIYINLDEPQVIINPQFEFKSNDTFNLWDDCMSFPHLLVHVSRHTEIEISFRDEHWKLKSLRASGALSELLQHEIDHLDGILCIDRAIDQRPFKWRW